MGATGTCYALGARVAVLYDPAHPQEAMTRFLDCWPLPGQQEFGSRPLPRPQAGRGVRMLPAPPAARPRYGCAAAYAAIAASSTAAASSAVPNPVTWISPGPL